MQFFFPFKEIQVMYQHQKIRNNEKLMEKKQQISKITKLINLLNKQI